MLDFNRPPAAPPIRRLSFPDEVAARTYLETLLDPYFVLKNEVWCRSLVANNQLRIDYVGRAKEGVEFPFDWFGVEVKRTCDGGGFYNSALNQAADYTNCVIDDPRWDLKRIYGRRIERVYVFPARPDYYMSDEAYWVNRLIGKWHVGRIDDSRGYPAFYTCADRQWCGRYGPRLGKHNTNQVLGSGVVRR
jgi:hypothetical protein